MKSSNEDLHKRGYVTKKDIELFPVTSQEQLLNMLHSNDAVTRTLAACHLVAKDERAASELLKQLLVEQCLYTKIAICDSLEKGDCTTAKLMVQYLGKIGNNQHHTLPDKVSKKKSFPLPRDIIARSLGRMSVEIFPVLQEVVKGSEVHKILEVLDAIGLMVYYNQELATSEYVNLILSLLEYDINQLMILWKAILCLSVFPLPESKKVLLHYVDRTDVIGMEAQRSLRRMEL